MLINKTWVVAVLITALICLPCSAAHIHLPVAHQHDGSSHQHQFEAHSHGYISHHGDVIDVAGSIGSHADVIDIELESTTPNLKKFEKSKSLATSVQYLVHPSCIDFTPYLHSVS